MVQPIARRLAKRTAQLEQAIAHFEPERRYTEPEVNEVLSQLFDDHVFVRRLLVDWGFFDRTADGSNYWRLK
jgi:hypothetical protein